MEEKYSDNYEKRASELVEQLKNKSDSERISIFDQAASLIKRSVNSEAEQMYSYFKGMSKQIRGKVEKDNSRAVGLFEAALTYFKKVSLGGEGLDEFHQTKVLKYKRELELNRKNSPKLSELFIKIAREAKVLNLIEDYHASLSLHHFYNSLTLFEKDRVKAINEIKRSLDEVSKTGHTEAALKVQSTYYRLLSDFQPDIQSKLDLLRKSLREIEKSADKHGLDECKATILFVTAQGDSDHKKKVPNFEKAAKLYKKAGFMNHYHNSSAWAKFSKIHNVTLNLQQSITLVNAACRHFKLAGNQIGYNHAKGTRFMFNAIEQGIVKDNSTLFLKNLAQANKHFSAVRDTKNMNFTAGIVLFCQAAKLKQQQAKIAFKKAGEILQSVHGGLSNLAFYEHYLMLTYSEAENSKARSNFMENALSHLEKWINFCNQPISYSRVSIPFDMEGLNLFYRAEYFNLKGHLSSEQTDKNKFFEKAISSYDQLISRGFYHERAWRAKGWAYIHIFAYDRALEAFQRASDSNPKSVAIKKEETFALELLKKEFRSLKQVIKQESRFRIELIKFISGHTVGSHLQAFESFEDYSGQSFIEKVVNDIQSAGKAIEENYPRHIDKAEEALRDEMVQCLKMFYPGISAESKKAKGKRDINILNTSIDKELTAECLVWKGKKYYFEKKEQLFNRYLTWHNKEAMLITFIRRKNVKSVFDNAKNAIEELLDIEKNSFQDLSHDQSLLCISQHIHDSGMKIRLYHLFFHLPKH